MTPTRQPATKDSALLEVTQADGYQLWRLCNAPVNALSPALLEALERQLNAANADESVAVTVITSGLKVFSAGADATWMAGEADRLGVEGLTAEFTKSMDRFRALCTAMRRSPILFLAALNGHTLAGGLELATACDLRYVADTDTLKIGVPEMDLFGALPSGGGGVQFLNRLMQPSRALQFILDAKPISPREAYSVGLVDKVVPADKLLSESTSFGSAVSAKAGRIGVAAAKRAVLGGAELPLYEALEFDRSLHWDAVRRGNFARGVRSFIDQFASSRRTS